MLPPDPTALISAFSSLPGCWAIPPNDQVRTDEDEGTCFILAPPRPRALLMADPEVSLSVCIGCGFKGPERKDKVDPRPNDWGGTGEWSRRLGMRPKPALLASREPWGLARLLALVEFLLAGSCLQPSQLLLQKQMTALMRKRK